MAQKISVLNIQTALLATTIGAATILGMYFYQKKRKIAIPTVWQPIGKVKGLYMYPLKSGRRLELQTAACTEYGIQSNQNLRDRCLVVYKEENKEFRTARAHPKMVLIEVTADNENHFIVNAPGMTTLQFNVPSLDRVNNSDEIVSWSNEKIFTIDCGDEAAQWFSKYILGNSSGLRLGFHDGLPLHRRSIEKTHQAYIKDYPYLENASMGLYTDLSSYMLMNQASVDELANRVPESITVHNFRPNILVEGENIGPYAEDNWDWIKIGEVILHNVKPCTRCIFTTINPETGIRSTNNEPLKTLKTYRKLKDLTQIDFGGQDPIMGNNMGLKHTGQINIGDTVFLGKN